MAGCNVHNSQKKGFTVSLVFLAGANGGSDVGRSWGYQKFPFIIGVLRSCHTGFRSAHLSFVCFFFNMVLSAKDYIWRLRMAILFHEALWKRCPGGLSSHYSKGTMYRLWSAFVGTGCFFCTLEPDVWGDADIEVWGFCGGFVLLFSKICSCKFPHTSFLFKRFMTKVCFSIHYQTKNHINTFLSIPQLFVQHIITQRTNPYEISCHFCHENFLSCTWNGPGFTQPQAFPPYEGR